MKSFSDYGIDLKGRTGRQLKLQCPKCCKPGSGAKDLSVNTVEKVWHCHKASCGWKGKIEDETNMQEPYKPKSFTLPKFINNTELPENVVKWFQARCIKQQTLQQFRITAGKEWMPQHSKEVHTIQFNYWRGDRLINTKFRTATKDFKMVTGAELILYNVDSLKNSDWAIITEGEMDALSFIEAGFVPVTSVPNGANKNLEYLDNCYDEIKHITKWYVAADADEAGQVLKNELLRRFGMDICFEVHYPDGIKDANEVLKAYGAEGVQQLITTAKQPPLQDVVYLENVRGRMLHQFKNGKEKGTSTYFESLDPHFTWKRGEVTVMGGIPNHGKTTILLQLMLIKSVKEGLKWAVFSPENSPADEFYDPLIEAYIGKGVDPAYPASQMSEEEYCKGMDFVGAHFFYVFPEQDVPTPVYINSKFKELIVRYGVDGCLIDPFNQMDKFKEWDTSKTDQYISDFLTHEKRFAQMHNVYKLIIAHPVKQQKNKDGGYDPPTAYDLHGGSMWYNKCDNILCYHRPYIRDEYRSTEGLFISQKIKKQKLVGLPGEIELNYDRKTGRYLENGVSPFELIGTNQHNPTHPAQQEYRPQVINASLPNEFEEYQNEPPIF